jgi:hypothetical protein
MNPNNSKKSIPLEKILFYFSLLFLLFIGGSFFYLAYTGQKADEEKKAIEATLAKQKTSEEKALETDVLSNRQRLQDFPVLIGSHKKATEFFRSLEAKTHPDVTFNSLHLNPADGTVELAGTAAGFETLAQQLIIFQNSEGFIKNVELSKISLNTEGTVDFGFSIMLDSQVLTF